MSRGLGASLWHYRRQHLALAAGVAVATAVLVGALVVGDSVDRSLRALALGRLGGSEVALLGETFFPESLADRLLAVAEPGSPPAASRLLAPLILLRGSVVHADSGRRATQVGAVGIEGRGEALFGAPVLRAAAGEADIFPPVWLSVALAGELAAAVGDDLLLDLPRFSEVPGASLLARRDASDLVRTLRVTVAGVLPDGGLGDFELTPPAGGQRPARSVFLRLADLAKALGRPGEVNALVAGYPPGEGAGAPPAAWSEPGLAAALRRVLTAADIGLRVTATGTGVDVGSRGFVLAPPLAAAVASLAAERSLAAQPTLAYLANGLRVAGKPSLVPYSTVLALDPAQLLPGARFELVDGRPVTAIGAGELLLSAWAADDLGAQVGQDIEVSYFVVGDGDQLVEQTTRWRLAGVVAPVGVAADPDLLPRVPGITDARSLAGWQAPFPFVQSRVRPQDEGYWRDFGTRPKAFVALASGQQRWGSRHGDLTSLRLAAAVGSAGTAVDLGREVAARVDPAALGLAWRPLRAEVLASRGASDFGGLFVAFSVFVLVSALLLVSLLFALAVEQRTTEAGLLRALGFTTGQVRRRLLAEAGVVAGVGVAVGSGLGLAYAALMLLGLRTWWLPAVGTARLELHVGGVAVGIGALVALALALTTMAWRLRRLQRVAPRGLLAGEPAGDPPGSRGRRARVLAAVCVVGVIGLTVAQVLAAAERRPILAFAAGGLLLVGGLFAFAAWCARAGRGAPVVGLVGLVASGLARQPGRSRLTVSLLAVACFVLVTLAASHHQPSAGGGLDGGLGGYDLLATADVPLRRDLQVPGEWQKVPGDWRELGIDDATAALLAGAPVTSFAVVPGDDVSCLNLYQPQRPRLLGVPASQILRGGFRFADVLPGDAATATNPWRWLERDLGPAVVPALGDAASVQWVLHQRLGGEITVRDEAGRPLRLRLVGLLAGSLFQGELLIPEAALRRHFPSRTGASFFLIALPDASRAAASEVAAGLEQALAPYGFDVQPAADRLAVYSAVEATYLEAFSALGGLGLLLGTVGLAIVVLRGVLERRGELAALRAIGFSRRRLVQIVAGEQALVLLIGSGLGTAAGLVAALPTALAHGGEVAWTRPLLTLAAVWGAGLLSGWLAARQGVRGVLLDALRGT